MRGDDLGQEIAALKVRSKGMQGTFGVPRAHLCAGVQNLIMVGLLYFMHELQLTIAEVIEFA